MMKEIISINPLSTTKIAAILGILWAALGWLFSSLVLSLLAQGSPEQLAGLPPTFSLGGLLSGVIGGFVGGAVSGYLGSLVYNLLAERIGGIKVGIRE